MIVTSRNAKHAKNNNLFFNYTAPQTNYCYFCSPMYYIIYGILYAISLLPFWAIYLISDFIFLLTYYVIKYRRKVVDYNLAIAFPEKTVAERKKIARKFYRNFTDNFIESIKLLSISKKELKRRFTANYDVINNLCASGKSVQVHLGHQFNWELAYAANAINLSHTLIGVYMPFSNKNFERLFRHLRTRFKTTLIPATNFRTKFHAYAKTIYTLALIADQSPSAPELAYWVNFFGRLTAFVKGPEKGAMLNRSAVVFTSFKKIKRGYYQAHNQLFTTDPRSSEPGEITLAMAKFIEDSVREDPTNYLWTHRRWKHSFDEKFRVNVVGKKSL